MSTAFGYSGGIVASVLFAFAIHLKWLWPTAWLCESNYNRVVSSDIKQRIFQINIGKNSKFAQNINNSNDLWVKVRGLFYFVFIFKQNGYFFVFKETTIEFIHLTWWMIKQIRKNITLNIVFELMRTRLVAAKPFLWPSDTIETMSNKTFCALRQTTTKRTNNKIYRSAALRASLGAFNFRTEIRLNASLLS